MKKPQPKLGKRQARYLKAIEGSLRLALEWVAIIQSEQGVVPSRHSTRGNKQKEYNK